VIRSRDHVQLAMPEGQEELARRFYGDVLGLPEVPKPEPLASRGGCWFEKDGVIVHLGVQKDFVPASKAHPAFTVADVDALSKRIAEAGYKVVPDDALPEKKRFYAFDPFGNRIEFIQDGLGFSQTDGPGVGLQPKLYRELADWWPLFSPPSHYAEEAADLLPVLLSATAQPPRTLLELGAGGGSLAFHLKGSLELTLTDLSPQMLEVSRRVNPECEHVVGDMRSLDLGREFDLVLIHDAIMYATDPASVRATLATAFRHRKPGGALVVVPDCVKETFEPKTSTGGEDGPDGRGLRYLEWTWDPDPSDDTYEVAFAFMLRERGGAVRVEHDRHRFGLFPRAAWIRWLEEAGFAASSRVDPWGRDVFIGKKPR
jgi:Methylase involved in ubiquinone/menaquinone biosynthesis